MSTEQPLFNFHEHYILRMPLLPFDDQKPTAEWLFEYSRQDFFKEAIYLASPVLHDELLKWHAGALSNEKDIRRLSISLLKYYTRMQSRSTPYGLFAGLCTGSWSDDGTIRISDALKRHTRLDMDYLCTLVQQLNRDTVLAERLRYYPNNSMYTVAGSLRYVEYHYVNGRRRHQISAVDNSEYLQLVLDKAKSGALLSEMTAVLLSDEISEAEAGAFVQELVSSQLLVSELEPAVTGDGFTAQLIGTLQKLHAASPHPALEAILGILSRVQQELATIDTQIGNDAGAYRSVLGSLDTLQAHIEEGQLFQTDLYREAAMGTPGLHMKQELWEAYCFLNRLIPKSDNSNQRQFIERFRAAYEEAEMPLLEVLDTETGIGYTGKDVRGINPLTDDLFIPSRAKQANEFAWNPEISLLHHKLIQAYKNDDYTIVFTDDDVKGINNTTQVLPDSLHIMFRVIDEHTVYFDGSGGSSSINLLGRFGHGDAAIKKLIGEIAAHEQQLNGRVLAEIVHLPESRMGNILLRPGIRNYEIPYLGASSLPASRQLPLQDLMVSVVNNRVCLRSKKLNKEIAPRLGSAHNFHSNALPAYQFLCDLQSQQTEKFVLSFDWGQIGHAYKFLPRAQYKNVIITRARWQLGKRDFAALKDGSDPEATNEWRKQLKMPRRVVLMASDNELMIDLENVFSVQMLLHEIRKKDSVALEEFLFEPETLVVKDQAGKGYTNEFIAVMMKNELVRPADQPLHFPEPSLREVTSVQRDYALGSEWLYYKLYCGVKTSDKLLAEAVKPLSEELLEKGWIDRFFFIRFNDPDLHIRLRFHLTDLMHLGNVIRTVNHRLQPWLENGQVSKLLTDTYKRELERYGASSMELSEQVFHIDSMATIQLCDLLEGDEGEQLRWQFALRSMDELLDNFGYSREAKCWLMETLKNDFIAEHGGTKTLKQQLNTKYRNVRSTLESILDRSRDAEKEIEPLLELLAWKRGAMQEPADAIVRKASENSLQVDFHDLVASYIHMMLNRIFKSQQRMHEMVIYDLLYRHYKSMAGREKYNPQLHSIKETV